jgi:hypothetical protein
MKATKISTLLTAAISVGILAYGFCVLLVRSGAQMPVSATTLIGTLIVIPIVLMILALPMFKYRSAIKQALAQASDAKKQPVKRVDPFYALRVALLSKAVSLSGAIFGGWHIGVLIAVLSSPQISSASVWRTSLALVASVAMVVCGLVVERACKVPPDASSSTDTEASPA